MKAIRKFLLCILCLAALSTAVFGLSACGEEVLEECPHSWNSWETVIAPTCQAEGLERRVCKLDSTHIEERTVEMLDHSFENYVSNNDATCAKYGTKTAYCTTLGCMVSNTVDDIGSQLPHDFSEMVIDEEYLLRSPSCTKPALYYYSCYCGACGTETFEDGEPVHDFGASYTYDEENHWYECSLCKTKTELAAHEWDDGEVTGEANCTEDGIKVYTCDCGATKEDVTPASHKLTLVPEIAATCQEEGSVAYWQCTVDGCGKKFKDENAEEELTSTKTEIVDHVWAVWAFDENGHAKKCIWCDETVEAAEHSLKDGFDSKSHFTKCECGYVVASEEHNISIQKNADVHWTECECGYVSAKDEHTNELCSSATKHWIACSYCDYALEREAHEYGEGVVTKKASCTEYGTKTYTCECGATVTEKIAPAHTYSELIPMVDSSCTEEGVKAHYVCLVCDMSFINKLGITGDLTIEKKSHEWALNYESEDGHFNECVNCGAKETDEVTGEVIIVPHSLTASVGDEVNHYDECVCSYIENAEAHTWNEGVISTPADCFHEGVKTYACFCGKTKTEAIPCHTMTLVEAKAATTCEDGNIAYLRCDVCQNTYYAPGATADNHDHLTVDDITIYATHNFEGGEVKHDENGHWTLCANCDAPSAKVSHTTERIGPDDDGYFWISCKGCEYEKRED